LRRKADFERLLRAGTRRSVEGYTLYVSLRQSGAPRLGLLVSRKHSARAVDRNRLKRSIREAFRLAQGQLGPIDILIRPPLDAKPSRDMIVRLQNVLTGLRR
jgi:ribonuclease P protein component